MLSLAAILFAAAVACLIADLGGLTSDKTWPFVLGLLLWLLAWGALVASAVVPQAIFEALR